MRIDVVSIFPDYLSPLDLSLPGKARSRGLLDLRLHDLRDWTRDRHRTVDDTPAGGGPGMVMRPEPWGAALDDLLPASDRGPGSGAVVIVPTPSGRPFTQALARELSTSARLVFACGRYEGIDERVVDHARERTRVEEISIGDYVLNGGEVAALAIIEAVVRLLPGFMGNAESLVTESHESGLLEGPVYTKPASWRGHDVPPVLRSGDHRAIDAWRHDQSVRRTAARRPDLLPAGAGTGEWEAVPASRADAAELLTLQLACWVTEAIANDDLGIPALHESIDDVYAALDAWEVYVVRVEGRLVASVRGRLETADDTAGAGDPAGAVWSIGRLMVAPDLRGRGLGRLLLAHIEGAASAAATSYRLIGSRGLDAGHLRRYGKAGYRVREGRTGGSGPAVLTKRISRR